MAYEFDHVHIKAADPGVVADWYVRAFDFTVVSDAVRPWGDRFVRCQTTDGAIINISGARTNEKMGPADGSAHWGIEHIGIKVSDIEAELERLRGLGAKLLEGPIAAGGGMMIAFIEVPGGVRVELLQHA